jgi:hypothetical protein
MQFAINYSPQAAELLGDGRICEWRSEARVIAEQVPPLYDMVKQAAVGG